MNVTRTTTDNIDYEIFKNPQLTKGSNSFVELVKEFAENYTDQELSAELINQPKERGKVPNINKESMIKIGGNNYLEFETNISILNEKEMK